MLVNLKFKDFYFALAIFISSIFITLVMAFYFKNIVVTWLSQQLKNEASSITKIINNELNNYKLNYYGIGELARAAYATNPESLASTPNIADAFGRTDNVALISNKDGQVTVSLLNNQQNLQSFYAGFTKEVQTDNFNRLLAYSYDTKSPVFYATTGVFEKNYITCLIPIDKASTTFYLVNISYENILQPVLKAGLFDANAKLMLSIQHEDKLLYATSGQQEETTTVKRKRNDTKITDNLTLTSSDLKLIYAELREPSLNNTMRQIPFIITLAGTVLSVLAFSLILSVTAILKYRTNNSN